MKRIQGALRNRGLLYFYMSTSKVFLNYTDWHDVDEEMRTVPYYGDHWEYGNSAGIFDRYMNSAPAVSGHFVASSYIQKI